MADEERVEHEVVQLDVESDISTPSSEFEHPKDKDVTLEDGALPIPEDILAKIEGATSRGRPDKEEPPAATDEEIAAAAKSEQEKEIKSAPAYARILAKKKRELEERVTEEQMEKERLLREMGEIKAAIREYSEEQRKARGEGKEETEPEPDPSIDPVGTLLKRFDRLEKRLAEKEQREQEVSELRATARAVGQVDSIIQAHIDDKSPHFDPVFPYAIKHIAQVMYTNLKDAHPEKSDKELYAMAQQSVVGRKIEWAANGVDPVEAMYNRAMTLGFDPEAVAAKLGLAEEAPQPQPKAIAKPAAQARQAERPKTIAELKRRTEGTGTIGGMVGSPPKRTLADALVFKGASEKIATVRKAVRDKELYTRKGRSLPDLDEFLAGKLLDESEIV